MPLELKKISTSPNGKNVLTFHKMLSYSTLSYPKTCCRYVILPKNVKQVTRATVLRISCVKRVFTPVVSNIQLELHDIENTKNPSHPYVFSYEAIKNMVRKMLIMIFCFLRAYSSGQCRMTVPYLAFTVLSRSQTLGNFVRSLQSFRR